jgi:hypothetical protein
MAEGPNDWEWQVGLATHEWKAAEDPVLTGLVKLTRFGGALQAFRGFTDAQDTSAILT